MKTKSLGLIIISLLISYLYIYKQSSAYRLIASIPALSVDSNGCEKIMNDFFIQVYTKKIKASIETMIETISNNTSLAAVDAYKNAEILLKDHEAFFKIYDEKLTSYLVKALENSDTDLFHLHTTTTQIANDLLREKYPLINSDLSNVISEKKASDLYKRAKQIVEDTAAKKLKVANSHKNRKVHRDITIESKLLFTSVTRWQHFNRRIGKWLDNHHPNIGWKMDNASNTSTFMIKLNGPYEEMKEVIAEIYEDKLTISIMGARTATVKEYHLSRLN